MPLMDINYLLHRQQISLAKANTAMSPEARRAHSRLARGYGAKLREGGYPHRAPIAWPIAPPSENPDREIGRSSCRERVCPYLLFSVSAVSLQTHFFHFHSLFPSFFPNFLSL